MVALAKQNGWVGLRYAMFAGLALGVALVVGIMISNPAIVNATPGGSLVYMVLLVILIVGYGLAAMYGTRHRLVRDDYTLMQGTRFGLLVGGLWIIEVLVGNLADNRLAWVRFAYFGAILAVVVATFSVGLLAAHHTGQAESGVMAGLWSGIVSGLITFLAGLLLSLFIAHFAANTFIADPSDAAGFRSSGLSDPVVYGLSENLLAFTNHLWIGPFVGVIIGGLGGFIGAGWRANRSAANSL